MSKFYLGINTLIVFILVPLLSFAQGNKNYSIMLNSGNFTPVENVRTLQQNAPVFQAERFNGLSYLVIQFNELPGEGVKRNLAAAGIKLIDYIPHLAYTAAVPAGINPSVIQAADARSVFTLTDVQKTVPDMLAGKVPDYALNRPGYADIAVLTYEVIQTPEVEAAVAAYGGEILTKTDAFRTYTLRVPIGNIKLIVALPFVQWAEFIDPPNVLENLPGTSLHRVSAISDGVRNLKGDGMNVGVWDGTASQHLDFLPPGRLTIVENGTPSSHGTHVSGTIGSRGLINPFARGMAPNAKIYSYTSGGNVQTEMTTAIPLYTLISSNHSYHDGLGIQCGTTGASAGYSLRARNTDINLNDNLYHLHCHSAGNAQTSCASGWGTITGTGKAAKNNLVVAAITSFEAMTSYSSFGPVHDGRVKPEISAMGDGVFSTYTPINTYSTISGTSMATPGVAGAVALLAQRYMQLNGNVLPPSALIKNISCNTAKDLGNAGPDYRFGFGRINALAAVRILEENRYIIDSVNTGAEKDITITVPAGSSRLRVMLTWNDPAAAANVSLALVNNLDLEVIDGANTTLPWVLDKFNPALPATKAVDTVSNIEQVTINSPAAGTYTLRVKGTTVPIGPNQTYALTWDVEQPYIEVIYPNGGESFSPGTTQVITWDNSGVTASQTVEYSLDNGVTWTTISSTVAANTTRLNWAAPAGTNTATALIRVSSGSLTDVSDLTFKILGTTTGFAGNGLSCDPGKVNFSWTAVANATHYDIYQLDSTAGAFVLVTPNVTGTSFVATGLTPSANTWFTIVAKNNITGAVSERSVAINVTVSGAGGNLGTVGSITGPNAICAAGSGVTYSIPPVTNATGYVWTVPSGAVIMSGQGTNNITVNYPAGSASGNVTVYASNSSCQTPPTSFAVTVSPAAAAPVSGGDQSATQCPPAPLPTLTATASVPAGHTITWYDAATGGVVVTDPSLNAVGTITYYAESTSDASGCQSGRTAVTLTINAAPPAVVTAGSTTTFCTGNSVVLTASTGTAYIWYNNGVAIAGAASQTFTANASGSYTVAVTNGTCVLTSSPTVVTVNALPVATVAAGGATTFCEPNNVTLTASAGSSWLWSNGATTQSITVSNSGTYSVTVTNASGCTATSASTVVTANPQPIVSLSAGAYTRLFPGLSTTLMATVTPPGTYTYVWTKGGILLPGVTTASLPVTINDLGSYKVTATNAGGCSNASATVEISDSVIARLFIMPNPSNGVFQVSYHSVGTNVYTLRITDSKGAVVYNRPYNINSAYQLMKVDIRNYSTGIYTVALFDRSGKRIAAASVLKSR